MKINVLTFFVLALTVVATACSSGGGGSGKANDKGGGGTVLPAGGTRPDALTKQPWCSNVQEQGIQIRLTFTANGAVTADIFALTAGARGQNQKTLNGTWYVMNNAEMFYTLDGKDYQEAVRLDPNSPTGAPQVVFGTGAEQRAYDPCN